MSNECDQLRTDSLLHALEGQDISNLTIIPGKCPDCKHNIQFVSYDEHLAMHRGDKEEKDDK